MSLDTEVYKEQDDNSGRRWKDTKIGRSLSGTEGDKVLLILIYITFLQHRPVHNSFWHVRQIISLHGQKNTHLTLHKCEVKRITSERQPENDYAHGIQESCWIVKSF